MLACLLARLPCYVGEEAKVQLCLAGWRPPPWADRMGASTGDLLWRAAATLDNESRAWAGLGGMPGGLVRTVYLSSSPCLRGISSLVRQLLQHVPAHLVC